jgi:beta-galactosidase
VAGGRLEAELDAETGVLRRLRWAGRELLAEGPRTNLWRAPTDNDGIRTWAVHPGRPLGRWLAWGLDDVRLDTEDVKARALRSGGVRVDVLQRARGAKCDALVEHRLTWTLLPSGDLWLQNRFVVPPELDDLPRLGLVLELAPGLEALRWLGRGPHESYWDRCAGARLALHESTVTDQYVPYIAPQEHGNHTDTRWLTLAAREVGVLVAGTAPFEFSASHYRAHDLYAARHTNELDPRPQTVLTLDVHQRGLGTASCGPDTLPRYRIKPGRHRLDLRLRPFEPGREDPIALARSAPA